MEDIHNFKEVNTREYKELTKGKNLPLTQNYFYGEWQEALGRTPRYFVAKKSDEIVSTFIVIKFPISFGKFYLYIPHGPVFFVVPNDDFYVDFKKFIKNLTISEGAIFCRFDPGIKVSDGVFFKAPKFSYSLGFQPKFEWVLDLGKNEAELLSGMKKVGRYTIKQAERLGIEVEITRNNFLQYFELFYKLMVETSARDGFSLYPKDYYLGILKSCEKNKNCFLSVAKHNDEILLINIHIIFGNTAFWLFGGSSTKEKKLGFTYLAQWRVIQEAKGIGLGYYNFGGVMPENKSYKTYKNWAGISDFKKKFGGFEFEYGDFYDVVANKFWYLIYLLRKFFV